MSNPSPGQAYVQSNGTANLGNLVPIRKQRPPATTDVQYIDGVLWVDTAAGNVYALTGKTTSNGVTSASWVLLGTSSGDIDTLTGDSGGALTPTLGNMNLLGGTNITSVGAGSTITFNLDPAITVATSVTTPLVVSPAASDLTLQAVAGQDAVITLGDAVGANKLSIRDSGAAEVAALDSNGNLTALSFATSAATAGANLTGATLAADGTDTNIDLTLTPKGTGNVDVTTGDLDLLDGNVVITGAGHQVQMQGGAVTDFIGTATLVAGTVTIANTNIAANDKIFLSYEGASIADSGQLSYTISAGVSFTIESTNGSDANDVSYFIVRQL